MNEKQETKISFSDKYGRREIQINKGDLTISEVFEDLVLPLLLAVGYLPETIDNYMSPPN